jgi:hypothetical protein
MFQKKVRTDENNLLAPQIDQVDQKVKQAAGQKVTDNWKEVGKQGQQYEEVNRVEETEAYIWNSSLDRLQLAEVAKHPAYAEITPALNVQQIVIHIDQDSTDGERDYLLPCQNGRKCRGCDAGQY